MHPDDTTAPRTFSRFVALGDSQTEGLNDGDDTRGYRGWADRLAEQLAVSNPDLRYANLAVRGHLAGQIHADQLEPALALRPDIATVVAGMNDILRPSFDPDEVAGHLDAMFGALVGAGALVGTLTFPDVGRLMPIARPLMPRVHALNARIRTLAARHGLALADSFPYPATTDPRIWSADRLHANSTGHTLIAAAMADAFRLPGSDNSWSRPLPPLPVRTRWQAAGIELRWLTTFVSPWLGRRLLGRSSGDNRTAKRPALTPVDTGRPADW
jgi:lysophospholipase L1-like esterase